MAGKVYEIAFQLAGKLGSTFHSTFLGAQKQISTTDQQIKKLTADQGKIARFDGLKRELVETGYKFQAAQLKVKQLSTELATAEKPTKGMERAVAKARGEVEKLQSKLESQHGALSKHQKAMDDAGLSTVKTAEQTKKLTAEMARLQAQKGTYEKLQASAEKFKASTVAAFKGVAIAAGAATAAVSGYYATAMKFANTAMTQAAEARRGTRLGFSAEAYQELSYAAKKVGVDVENFEKSMTRFRVNMSKAGLGTGPLANELKLMGYDVPKTMANLNKLKPEEQLMKMSEFMKSLPDDATRTRLAVELFGKEGMKMMNFMKLGASGLQEFRNEARATGNVMTAQDMERAKQYGLMKQYFGMVWKGAQITIGSALLPALTGGMEEFISLVKANREDIQLFAKNFADGLRQSIPAALQVVRGVKNIATTLIDMAKGAAFAVGGFDNLLYIATALFAGKTLWAIGQWGTSIGRMISSAWQLRGCLQGVSVATRLWAAAQGALNIAWAANPAGVVLLGIAAIVAAGYLIYKNWGAIKNFMTSLWNSPTARMIAFVSGPIGWLVMAGAGIIANWEQVKQWFNLLWDQPGAAFMQFIDLVRGKFGELVNWLGDKVNSVKEFFNNLGSPGNPGGGAGYVPHAAGGIFDRPHIGLVAEAGVPEAVIPLERSRRSMGLLQQASEAMGVGQPQGFAALNLTAPVSAGRSGGTIEIQHSPVYNIYGDRNVQSQVESAAQQSNDDLIRRLLDIRAQEERVSLA